MSSLALTIAGVMSGFILLLWWHHASFLRQCQVQITQCHATTGARELLPKPDTSFPSLLAPILLSLFVLALSVGVYSLTGRFSGWDTGKPDVHTDYLVAADITRGRQAIEQNPDDEIALLALAQSYAAGGMYLEAVTTLDQLLILQGEQAELLGMKATALYYRDGRTIAPDTGIVIARALALHREELQTRLLLATDAYLSGDYAGAIRHWQILLENRTQPFNRAGIHNAISKAQSKLDPDTNTEATIKK
ncbi:nitrite reductase [Shewanella sp. NFH-SH190041]|uniref:nitrite reductase n=1 Tax=Shewanella sp. NFH-SH190041 TaxID=2950245 RepID=UPI0021C43C5E|nr:nitrite reductase [Shewanella sp. NFH-SH190041]BDM62990.1 nitrite reductase [Shewanella sp. NFH-SH190041]